MKKYLERRLSRAGLLLFKEKHGSRYFVCEDQDAFCRAAMHVLKERLAEGYWYHDDSSYPDQGETRAREIVESNDLEAAFEFMDLRSDAEYEEMYIEYPEKY
jgi:hypothetical protein